MKTKKMKIGLLKRDMAVGAVVDKKAKTVELSFMSEEPYRRYFGMETLKMSGADLSRAHAGNMALLVNHNPDDQVGTVERAWVENGRGKAIVRLGNSARADEIWDDMVVSEIRKGVSLGYVPDEMELTGKNDIGVETYDVTKFTVHEISIVPIPADITVGVGRNRNYKDHETVVVRSNKKMKLKDFSHKHVDEFDGEEREAENQWTPLQKEQNRTSEILSLGKFCGCMEDAIKAVGDGTTLNQFRKLAIDFKAQRQGAVRPAVEQPFSNGVNLGMSKQEAEKYSILRAAEAAVTGNWTKAGIELEAHRAIQEKMGPTRSGNNRSFYMPFDVMTRAVATSGSGANLTANQILPGQFIDVLRNASRVIEAGARTLNGLFSDVDIPRVSTTTSASWIGEGEDSSETTPTFDQVSLAFKTVSGYCDITRKQRVQSCLDIENLIQQDLFSSLSTAMDLGALNGSGTSNQPRGILNTPGINVVDFTNLGQPSFGEIVDMETTISVDNALLGRLGYMCNATLYGQLKKTQKVAGEATMIIEDGKMNGYPVYPTNQVPANTVIFGNWADLLIGIFGPGLELNADTATLSKSGGLRLVAMLSCDIAARHPQSFCSGSGGV